MTRKENPEKEVVTLQHRTATGTTSREKITPTRLPPPPLEHQACTADSCRATLPDKISGKKHDPRNKPIRIPEASTGGEGAHGTPPLSLGIDLGEEEHRGTRGTRRFPRSPNRPSIVASRKNADKVQKPQRSCPTALPASKR